MRVDNFKTKLAGSEHCECVGEAGFDVKCLDYMHVQHASSMLCEVTRLGGGWTICKYNCIVQSYLLLQLTVRFPGGDGGFVMHVGVSMAPLDPAASTTCWAWAEYVNAAKKQKKIIDLIMILKLTASHVLTGCVSAQAEWW